MTELICYHRNTKNLAVFFTVFSEEESLYWIGSFNPNLTHQNGKPLYTLVDGYWSVEYDALDRLRQMTGYEF